MLSIFNFKWSLIQAITLFSFSSKKISSAPWKLGYYLVEQIPDVLESVVFPYWGELLALVNKVLMGFYVSRKTMIELMSQYHWMKAD